MDTKSLQTADSVPATVAIDGLADLLESLELRELGTQANIASSLSQRRLDVAHPGGVPEIPACSESPERRESTGPSRQPAEFVVPRFDPKLLRFTCGTPEGQMAAWKDDETVRKVALDEVLVCPCCSALPTFRYGCGVCGSAWIRPDTLIHHYACAYIGSESEFRQGNDLVCPKCRQTSLVAGSDFETVSGGQTCADCHTGSSLPELIGHCLNCQHRFPADEAATLTLTGFHVVRAHEVTLDPGPDQQRQLPTHSLQPATT